MPLLQACAQFRKQKNRRTADIDPISAADLIEIDTLGNLARRKALYWDSIGELSIFKIDGKYYAERGDLADWGVIDFGCSVSSHGRYHG